MISSPRYVDDFIERKAKEAESDPRIFCRRRAIWESLPDDIIDIREGNVFEMDGEKIPLKYKQDFEKNPDKAWRDLGARPSLTLEPYIKQWTLVEQAISPDMNDPMTPDERFADWFVGQSFTQYFVHVDLALSQCSAGFCMGHWENENIILDFVHAFPPPKDGREIELKEFVWMIKELKARGFNIVRITYDQFQSAMSIQELQKIGFNAGRKSCEDLAVYETMKEQFYMGKIRMYEYPPLMSELRRLELIKGKKVDHPPKGSKDVADAVAGVVHTIVEESGLYQKVTVSIL